MSFPKPNEIQDVLKKLENVEPSRVIDRENASATDRAKYDLCFVFVEYILKKNISQSDLAKELGVDRARVNKIVKYRIEYFTIDKLLELLNVIKPGARLQVS